MRLDEMSDVLKHCGSCNYCRDYCPMYIQLRSEFDSPGGKIRVLRAYAEKMRNPPPELLESLYCADCRKCEVICPANVPVTQIWHDAKVELLKTGGKMSESLQKVLDWIGKEGTPFVGYEAEVRTEWAEDLELPEDSETAVFSGCMGSFWYPDQPETIVDLLKKKDANVGYIPSEACCGLFNYWAGDDVGFKKLAQHNYEMFKRAGVKRIVTGCGGCFGTLAEHYEHLVPNFDIKVHHTVELLAEMIRDGSLKLGEFQGKWTFHDSCHLGRALGVYDPPREIINAIPGIEFVELPTSRENSNCCGGFLTVLDPELSEAVGSRRVQEAVELGVDGIITSCVSCYKSLSYCARDAGIEVRNLEDLLLELAE